MQQEEDEVIVVNKPDKSPMKKVAMVVVSILVAGGVSWAGWGLFGPTKTGISSGLMADAKAKSNASVDASLDSVVATVNGERVTQYEIAGLVSSGFDKAIVVDRYINKVIAAERGRKLYAKEAEVALKAAEREVLATLFTTKRMDELRAQVTDEQVKAYYDQNVRDENFRQWKVSYYLSADANDVRKTLDLMKQGDSKALGQLKLLVEQGDGFAAANSLPYNLGRVVSKMKKGEISEPLPLRNGLLVLRVDDYRQQEKPKLEAVRQEIIQELALKKFNEELEQARQQAKVELG